MKVWGGEGGGEGRGGARRGGENARLLIFFSFQISKIDEKEVGLMGRGGVGLKTFSFSEK